MYKHKGLLSSKRKKILSQILGDQLINVIALNSGVFRDCTIKSLSENTTNPQTSEGNTLSKDKVVTKLNSQ